MTDDWAQLDRYRLKTGHVLKIGQYRTNNRPALEAWTPEGECECSITVNLDDPLEEQEFFVRLATRKHASQVFEALIDEKLAEPTGRVVSAGYVQEYAEVWRIVSPELNKDVDFDDPMDGDHESALASAGFGTDEDYGYFGGPDDW